MKVKNRTLLLIAAIVWGIAGFNILRIGIVAYSGYWTLINLLISLVIFSLFWFMVFKNLVVKHTKRIVSYREEKTFFLKFFDVKSFIIMAVMMTLGISIRSFNLWPLHWIAVFYLGLGAALFLAGLLFLWNYFSKADQFTV
ncbi:hypothetical protein [Facklamia miroungae]|uniref:Uncharacterized protein n=1 Tax=Facklamia miroungae TaxID=120956 RepID=A0A1G7QA73_9LACT|nr:hypothetical protein [Facklamia miroungae]NKZ28877.1 hypothetical protein [Facklamia miroungae]SDF95432.1 hypothetical protein SAMN05421791_10225 [Facklamia miroungae]